MTLTCKHGTFGEFKTFDKTLRYIDFTGDLINFATFKTPEEAYAIQHILNVSKLTLPAAKLFLKASKNATAL